MHEIIWDTMACMKSLTDKVSANVPSAICTLTFVV